MCKSISKGSCSYHISPTLLKQIFLSGQFLKNICGFTSKVMAVKISRSLAIFFYHARIYRQSDVVGKAEQNKLTTLISLFWTFAPPFTSPFNNKIIIILIIITDI